MLLTQLEYFVAVAREQHFGRAAASCYVSPSALSEAIRKLEAELDVPLIRRGRAFEGLTPEGELALVWARRLLADDRALRDSLAAGRERLAAEVRFGVIPSGVARAAALLTTLSERHPLTRVRMLTGLTTEEIVKRLRRYELDAGLVHPSVDDADDLMVTPLYEEAMMVVGPSRLLPPDAERITGRELNELPVCLLETRMRARQLLDSALDRHGITLAPRIESDSIEGLLALARTGSWVTVVPASAASGALTHGLRILPLKAPEVHTPIALVRLAEARDRPSPRRWTPSRPLRETRIRSSS